jgi:hypothetical protein
MKWRESTFLLPGLIAMLGLAGLFAALLGDGWWDALAWLGLGLPAVLSVWALPRRNAAMAERTSTRVQQP